MKLTKEEAKKINILDLANSLGMDMIKASRKEYYWSEHNSFKINIEKNTFYWYSKGYGGDTIELVMTIKDLTFKQALNYLETGDIEKIEIKETKKEPFTYHLGKYETNFTEARQYLKTTRGLSDETINYFLEKNVISQVKRKTKDGYEENVIVFKYLDENKKIIGGSLQGITPNKERYQAKGYLKQIMYNSEGTTGYNIQIGEKTEKLIYFEAPIDMMSYYELNKNKLNNVKLIAMDGLKDIIIAKHFINHILNKSTEKIKNKEEKNSLKHLEWIIKKTDYFEKEENKEVITIAVDNDKAGKEFIQKFKDKGLKFKEELPETIQTKEKTDWNDILKQRKEEKTKMTEKDIKKDLEKQGQNKREDFNQGSLQFETEGSTTPELNLSSFERSVTRRPTISSHLLYFNIKEEFKSSNKGSYHYITEKELMKLNRRANNIQEIARYYKENLADTKISYFTTSGNIVQVDFKSEHFMHLIGIKAVGENQTPEKTLLDLSEGNGLFDNIQLANQGATFEKINALLDLEIILDTNSIYFDELQSIPRYKDRFNRIIKSDDKDIMILFRNIDNNEIIPVSIFKARNTHNKELEQANKNSILGIYREKEGKLEQISINENYIKDNGKEMYEILKNNLLEKENEEEKSNKTVTEYLKENKITEVNNILKENIKEYTKVEEYKKYLKTISNLINYSKRNIDLIYQQNKNASQLASYNEWQKYGRQVKKGEKGLIIKVPRQIIKKDSEGNPLLDLYGKEQTTIYYGKKVLFDIKQTEGKEIKTTRYNLEKENQGYLSIYLATKQYLQTQGIKIQFQDLEQNQKGKYNKEEKTIQLNKGMTEEETIKTLLQETANTKKENKLEAESLGYIINNYFGINTQEYKFDTLQKYTNNQKSLEEIDKLIQNIHEQAKELTQKIETNYQKIKREGLEKNPLQEKIKRIEREIEQTKEGGKIEKKFPHTQQTKL